MSIETPNLLDLIALWVSDDDDFRVKIDEGYTAPPIPIIKFYVGGPLADMHLDQDLWVATMTINGYIWTPFAGLPFHSDPLTGMFVIHPTDPDFFKKLRDILDQSTKLLLARIQKESKDTTLPSKVWPGK